MNKIVIVVPVVILLTAGIGWRVYTESTSPTSPADNSDISDNTNTDTENKFQGTLNDLIRLGQNYSCTFDNTDDVGNVTTGKVYIAESGNKMNGKFETTLASDGSTSTTNIITDSTYSYVWSDQMEQAYKYAIDYDPASDLEDKEASQIIDGKENMNFNCARWNIDNAMFIPPSDIEFIDIQAQMQEMQQQAESDINISCDTCDQLPAGDAKEQCLQALDCN